MFSDRVNRIALSPTLRIGAKAGQMRAQGLDVVDFSVGEPDFPTPEPVKRAAKAAIDANFTKYTANDGIPDLKKAICDKLLRENGLKYSADEVIVSPGAKVCLFQSALALYGPGDDVLIPSPYWVSYPDQVTLAGANPVFLPTREEDGFRLRAKTLAGAITPNTKALILNYPCNPTGATYSREDLEAIADVCVKEDIWVVSDEIYERLIYDGARFQSIASLNEKIKKRTLVINGFSKAYSMTGWRLGYAAGPRELIQALSKIQSHNTSNATSFVQKAAIEALERCSMEVERMKQEFERRRNAIVYRLRAIPGVSCPEPRGAFYAFPNVARYLDKEFGGAPIRNTYGLGYYLLKEAHVAVIPGQAFGSDEHIRFSFALSMDRIEEGMKRVSRALARLEEPKRLRPRALNNVVTKVKSAIPPEALAVVGARNAALAEAEAHLKPDAYFEWNASIAGIVVQLRSNSPHLADFYQENFFPASLDGELEPHAVVYAVKDVPGREAQAAVSLETATGFLLEHRVLRAAPLDGADARRRRRGPDVGSVARSCRRAGPRRARRARVGRAGVRPHGRSRSGSRPGRRPARGERGRFRSTVPRRAGGGASRAEAVPQGEMDEVPPGDREAARADQAREPRDQPGSVPRGSRGRRVSSRPGGRGMRRGLGEGEAPAGPGVAGRRTRARAPDFACGHCPPGQGRRIPRGAGAVAARCGAASRGGEPPGRARPRSAVPQPARRRRRHRARRGDAGPVRAPVRGEPLRRRQRRRRVPRDRRQAPPRPAPLIPLRPARPRIIPR